MRIRVGKALVLAAAALALVACNLKMSYKKASKMRPYVDIADEDDRRWLYDHHMTRSGALGWVEDEIHLRDNTVRFWVTSDRTVEIEDRTLGRRFVIKTDKVIALAQSKGGDQAAQELLARTRKEIGGASTLAERPFILPGFTREARFAQKLRYPKLWKEWLILATQEDVQKGGDLRSAGRLDDALQLLAKAIDTRAEELGLDHPATQGALSIYKGWSGGRDYTPKRLADAPEDPAAEGAPASPATQAEVAEDSQTLLAKADALLAEAGAAWQSGDTDKAVQSATQALEIRKKAFGPDHAKVKEIETMLDQARGANPPAGPAPVPAPPAPPI